MIMIPSNRMMISKIKTVVSGMRVLSMTALCLCVFMYICVHVFMCVYVCVYMYNNMNEEYNSDGDESNINLRIYPTKPMHTLQCTEQCHVTQNIITLLRTSLLNYNSIMHLSQQVSSRSPSDVVPIAATCTHAHS